MHCLPTPHMISLGMHTMLSFNFPVLVTQYVIGISIEKHEDFNKKSLRPLEPSIMKKHNRMH